MPVQPVTGGSALDELFGNEEILKAVPPRAPRVGEWVRYRYRDKTRTMEGFVRLAIVPPATPPDAAFWFEISTGYGNTSQAKMKYLTRGLVLIPGRIERAVISMDETSVIDLPPEAFTQPVPADAFPLRAKVTRAGKARDTIRVPAGSFDSVHLKLQAAKYRGDLWMCPEKVPIYGLVRAEDKQGTIELEAMGENAVSEVGEATTREP
jgi:hypothetical protein